MSANHISEADSEAQLLLDSVPATIWQKDAHNRILRVNKAAAESLGLLPGEIEGKTCEDLFPAEDAARYYADDLEVIRSGKSKLGIVELMRTASGVEKWMRTDKIPHKDAQGRIVGVLVFAVDITDHKRTEEKLLAVNMKLSKVLQELKHAQEQALQHERLDALGHIAGGVAHDFNNALMPILGFTDLLLETPGILDDRKKTVEMLELVRLGAKNAADTVRRLREFYRAPDRSMDRPIDLSVAVRKTVALTRPKWKDEMEAKGIDVDMRTEIESAPLVMGNEQELLRLMTNLILNSVEALSESGTVTIRLHADVSQKDSVIEVTDTGTGMTEETRRRCLDPFFSTKGGRGVGLGLSIAHGIVRRHKGSMDIESIPGKGTKVVCRFPAAESQSAVPADG